MSNDEDMAPLSSITQENANEDQKSLSHGDNKISLPSICVYNICRNTTLPARPTSNSDRNNKIFYGRFLIKVTVNVRLLPGFENLTLRGAEYSWSH